MKFTLPPLGYSFDALEPYIDARTMEIHYTKHHQAYIDNLNKALEGHERWQNRSVEDLLTSLDKMPAELAKQVRNNGGGHFNHSLFWPMMEKHSSAPEPLGRVAPVIRSVFGSFEKFQQEFNEAAKKVFGSGWAWLVLDGKGDMRIISTANQDNPISQGMVPLLGLDVWEHAYYLKYQNKRVDYIQAWWNVINWETVEEHYQDVHG